MSHTTSIRAAGIDTGHALIPVDDVLLEWADEIVCMDEYQQKILQERTKKPVHDFRVGDNFEYRDKGLVAIIKIRAFQTWGMKDENVQRDV